MFLFHNHIIKLNLSAVKVHDSFYISVAFPYLCLKNKERKRMNRYFIYLSYNGKNYCGWQKQPNGPTVQQATEEALGTWFRTKIPLVGAGRTDAGVHARRMVAHFDLPGTPCNLSFLAEKLNRLLPRDVAVEKILPVRENAHARFDALSRTYHYYASARKDPFNKEFVCRLHAEPDFGAMNDACRILCRYTDFTSFSKLHTDVKTNNCRIAQASWTNAGEVWQFAITADRFLRNMVRAIVGTLLEVGRGKLSAQDFKTIIEAKDRGRAGASAPAHALFLYEITYPEDVFKV
jgi:tRNA pseudouridine38-40 synthase